MGQRLHGELGSYLLDNLMAGEKVPVLVKGIRLAPAQGILPRGAVIGTVSASGLGRLADKAASDGSQAAKYILTDEVDTGAEGAAEALTAQAYQSGEFNRGALTFAAGNTAADHEDNLRQYGIYLKDHIAY